MHTIQQALDIVLQHTIILSTEKISIKKSLGKLLAEDVYALDDIPNFDQSAVDGYAIRFEEFSENAVWEIADEIKAGDNFPEIKNTKPMSCIKIFTGALVPSNYNCIVMKEYAEKISDSCVTFKLSSVKPYQNIRKRGEEVKQGNIVFKKHTIIRPEHIAILASMGKSEVLVMKDITVRIIVTGNELKEIDDKSTINAGEKFESNGILLKNLFQKYLGLNINYSIIKDDKERILDAIKQVTDECDIVITTGGVSVGDYDFTKQVIKELGFEILIEKVAQKPGKPFVFAVRQNKVIFGLPGNPRATLSCFYWYILRYIRKCYGLNEEWIRPVIQMKIENDYIINDNRARILFINIENDKIKIPDKQDSHMLISSAMADAIILLDKSILKGESIKVYLL